MNFILKKKIPISKSDEERLSNYRQSGDMTLMGALFSEYMHLVYGLCLKYLKDTSASQDAVMDIYETIARKLSTTEVSHFKSWLYMVSKNHCLMILRRKNMEINMEVFMETPDTAHLKEEKLELEDDFIALEQCLEELREEQRECVKRFFLKKESYHQVSNATGIILKKVKSHIQNGKRNLKICLESKNVNQ